MGPRRTWRERALKDMVYIHHSVIRIIEFSRNPRIYSTLIPQCLVEMTGTELMEDPKSYRRIVRTARAHGSFVKGDVDSRTLSWLYI